MRGIEDEDGTTEEEPVSEYVVVAFGDVGKGLCQSGAVGVSEPGGGGFHKTVSSVVYQAKIVRNAPQ